jgi:two-component system, chemotaxis family, response regulator Rcp1
MFPSNRSLPLEILLVEDNLGDIRLLEEAFKEAGTDLRLHVVRDGEEAMAFLHQKVPYETSPRPSFILLDLNMPRKDGREVLAEIKEDRELRQIPVFILSTSSGFEDISNCYHHHANCYIPKPVDMENLVKMSQRLQDFWLCTAVLPN